MAPLTQHAKRMNPEEVGTGLLLVPWAGSKVLISFNRGCAG